jgi:hypothetical protein
VTYHPIRDAAVLRVTLKHLAEAERLTSQGVVDLFNAARAKGDNLSISRATLDRFVRGEDITKIRELRVIYDLLRTHPAYGAYFPAAQPEEESNDLVSLLGRFLAPGDDSGGPAPDGLSGRFLMMRRDNDTVALPDGLRVSTLTLAAAGGGVSIEERQSYRPPDFDIRFEQTDQGWLFTHAGALYFLMKESGGSAVKFGVITQMLPEPGRDQPVQYFQGFITVVSRRGVFPRTRFTARRMEEEAPSVVSGVKRLTEVDDPRAADYLRLDRLPGADALTG